MDLVDLRFPTTIANLRECVVNHVYYADQTQIESMCSASAKCECAEVVITVWSEVRCVHVSYSSQISTRLLHISITHTPHRVSTASRRSFFFWGGGTIHTARSKSQLKLFTASKRSPRPEARWRFFQPNSSALVSLRGTNVGNLLPTFRPGGARAIES
jgi:hypothetical protein